MLYTRMKPSRGSYTIKIQSSDNIIYLVTKRRFWKLLAQNRKVWESFRNFLYKKRCKKVLRTFYTKEKGVEKFWKLFYLKRKVKTVQNIENLKRHSALRMLILKRHFTFILRYNCSLWYNVCILIFV